MHHHLPYQHERYVKEFQTLETSKQKLGRIFNQTRLFFKSLTSLEIYSIVLLYNSQELDMYYYFLHMNELVRFWSKPQGQTC